MPQSRGRDFRNSWAKVVLGKHRVGEGVKNTKPQLRFNVTLILKRKDSLMLEQVENSSSQNQGQSFTLKKFDSLIIFLFFSPHWRWMRNCRPQSGQTLNSVGNPCSGRELPGGRTFLPKRPTACTGPAHGASKLAAHPVKNPPKAIRQQVNVNSFI